MLRSILIGIDYGFKVFWLAGQMSHIENLIKMAIFKTAANIRLSEESSSSLLHGVGQWVSGDL